MKPGPAISTAAMPGCAGRAAMSAGVLHGDVGGVVAVRGVFAATQFQRQGELSFFDFLCAGDRV